MNNTFKNLIISVFFGALIGLSTALYVYVLDGIQIFHLAHEAYPMLLSIVFLIIFFVKRSTLYFPTSVYQITEAGEAEQKQWSLISYFANLFGSWISHFAGASLGREGTVLVLSASLANIFKLNWNYYRPIIISAAFACVVGQPFIALVFIIELFTTSFDQKLFSILMAWAGVLVLQSFKINSLFQTLQVDLTANFLSKIFVVVTVGLIIGLSTFFFKRGYFYLSDYFFKNKISAFIIVLILTWIMMQPQLKIFQSLSLNEFIQVQNGKAHLEFVILKFILTLFFVSLGFIGGDFVPAIIIGSSVGVLIAEYFKVNYTFGFAMGLFAFFTGTTRLKWTGLWMIYLLSGFDVMLWSYLCLSITRQFSGSISLYKKNLY